MVMHFADTPISFTANMHLVVRLGSPNPQHQRRPRDGARPPGIGIESLNEALIKQHLHPDFPGYFEPAMEWDKDRTNDRL